MIEPAISLREPDARANKLSWRLGTMGLAYKEWRGNFYPQHLPMREWLRCYATQFSAIEMNTTFYATPDRDRLEAWAAATPADFRFAIKVGRHVTHDTPLVETPPLLTSFVEGVRPLGEKLGPLLLQLAPHHRARELGALRYLFRSLPRDVRFALELRHYSWRHERVFPQLCELLAEHNVALVGLDHEQHPEQSQLVRTADFLYVRLVGRHGRYETQSHELFDPTPALAKWQQRIEAVDTLGLRDAWVLFNNDYAGHGPTTLRRFARLAEAPLAPSPVQQKRLFE
jgi:uncharacterized protein YecE (DUF72 family)